MKKNKVKIILIVSFLLGLFALIYPPISQYWNSKYQTKVITDYEKMFSTLEEEDYSQMFVEAENYNNELFNLEFPLIQYKNILGYNELINVNNSGILGYISIKKIKIELPIYHGTSSSVLNVGVGHLEGSSLPIGGINTHSVLSAHRGLPSAKLFTNLNKLEIGDIFEIIVLDRKLTYQVDNIFIIEPNDVSKLEIEEGKDYVTLMTCTPYGINSHRLLVRGSRIENEENKEQIITSDAYIIDKLYVTFVIAFPILLILIIYIMFMPIKKKEEV